MPCLASTSPSASARRTPLICCRLGESSTTPLRTMPGTATPMAGDGVRAGGDERCNLTGQQFVDLRDRHADQRFALFRVDRVAQPLSFELLLAQPSGQAAGDDVLGHYYAN
jgi:hypothetical protein